MHAKEPAHPHAKEQEPTDRVQPAGLVLVLGGGQRLAEPALLPRQFWTLAVALNGCVRVKWRCASGRLMPTRKIAA